MMRALLIHLAEHDLCGSHDACKRIVQFMGDTCCKRSDAGHFFGPHQLLLHVLLLGDVVDDLNEDALALVRRTHRVELEREYLFGHIGLGFLQHPGMQAFKPLAERAGAASVEECTVALAAYERFPILTEKAYRCSIGFLDGIIDIDEAYRRRDAVENGFELVLAHSQLITLDAQLFKGKCIFKRKAALGGQYFQRLALYFADQSLCVIVADENVAGDLLAENQGNQHIGRRQGTADLYALFVRSHTDDRTLVLLLVQLQLLLDFTGKGKNNFLADFTGGWTVVVGYQKKLLALVIAFCHKHNPLCFQTRTQALDHFVAQVMKIDNRREPLAQVLDRRLIRVAFGNYDGID